MYESACRICKLTRHCAHLPRRDTTEIDCRFQILDCGEGSRSPFSERDDPLKHGWSHQGVLKTPSPSTVAPHRYTLMWNTVAFTLLRVRSSTV